jgi:O-antigen/teichoic acid export membrane protein
MIARHLRLTNNVALLVASTTLSKLSVLIVGVIMARSLGAQDFGLYAFAIAFAYLLELVPRFGFPSLVSRDVARDPSRGGEYLGTIILLKCGLSAVALAAAVVAVLLPELSATRRIVMSLALATMLADSFFELFASFYRAAQVMEYEARLQIALAAYHTAIGVTLFGLGFGLVPFLVARLLGHAVAAALAYRLVSRRLTRPVFELTPARLVATLRRAAPLAAIGLFVTIYVRIDVILLSLIAGDVSTGLYAAAQRVIGVFSFLPAAIAAATLPALSAPEHTKESMTRDVEQMVKYLFILSLPLAIGFGLQADVVVALLYGEAYRDAAPALAILAWTLVMTFVNHGLSTTLVALQRERTVTAIVAGGALFNVLANVAAVPLWQHVGASATTLATELLIAMLGLRAVRRRLSTVQIVPMLTRPLLAGLIMAAIIRAGAHHDPLWVVPLAFAGYLGVLLAVGGMPRSGLVVPLRSMLTVLWAGKGDAP